MTVDYSINQNFSHLVNSLVSVAVAKLHQVAIGQDCGLMNPLPVNVGMGVSVTGCQ